MTSTSSSRTTLTARSPEDVLAAVPVVLGFEPDESIVMLTFGAAETFHARLDLPCAEEVDEAVSALLEPAARFGVAAVVFVLYSRDVPACERAAAALERDFEARGIGVLACLRADGERWFGRCGPGAEGVPYDPSAHRFRVQSVVEGQVTHRSRSDLAATLAADPPQVARVAARLDAAVPEDAPGVHDAVRRHLSAARFPDEALARVLLGMRDSEVREAAWAEMGRGDAPAYVRLWTDAVQRAPDHLVPDPAAVLALAAWLAGDGALAWCAVDRCRAVEPQNSLGLLVTDALVGAVPPSAWAH